MGKNLVGADAEKLDKICCNRSAVAVSAMSTVTGDPTTAANLSTWPLLSLIRRRIPLGPVNFMQAYLQPYGGLMGASGSLVSEVRPQDS